MNTLTQLELAEKIATELHEGQFRRDGLTPYIEHPKTVAEKMDHESLKAIAWLHDVIEDCGITKDQLQKKGINNEICDAVLALTKHDGEDYKTYLWKVRSNYAARRVKVADIVSNLTDSPTEKQVKKYTGALIFLVG